MLLEQNDEWPLQRGRYLSPDTIAPLGDDRIEKRLPSRQLDLLGPAGDHDGRPVVTLRAGPRSRPFRAEIDLAARQLDNHGYLKTIYYCEEIGS